MVPEFEIVPAFASNGKAMANPRTHKGHLLQSLLVIGFSIMFCSLS
jgi:hypothetical protein